MHITFNYWPIATKVLPFVAHAWKRRVRSKIDSRSRNTAERVLRNPSKVFLIIDRSKPNLHRL